MKNYEIANINGVLMELLDQPIKGKLKFKLFKLKVELENKLKVVSETLKDVDDEEERTEIINEEQEVSFETFEESDLENLELSIRQLSALQPILKGEDK
ncbi:hypothetical protein [Marinilactibacillus psychrotolerans]|uniref:Uncharacterized protein n=1 Tax=Marinilactibacillus psychrotolerans TaxID=191770 RepID=A0AAV3WTR1_9LACT|nr:hypothetical protein [Marinilactibacillus psychrotolerans]GEL67259.1 hypothetical protein MPS01_14140 [Marinilactibacillus psychrotolerans]GEQ36063.1 hypothetical protein M132T_15710 [Marinilactibacillus psychrotolerans]SDC62041.1 hypothetical protein SAMN04488013_10774 [Marinilactibacillus psychrotolerans]